MPPPAGAQSAAWRTARGLRGGSAGCACAQEESRHTTQHIYPHPQQHEHQECRQDAHGIFCVGERRYTKIIVIHRVPCPWRIAYHVAEGNKRLQRCENARQQIPAARRFSGQFFYKIHAIHAAHNTLVQKCRHSWFKGTYRNTSCAHNGATESLRKRGKLCGNQPKLALGAMHACFNGAHRRVL